jgi:hypothetical protein
MEYIDLRSGAVQNSYPRQQRSGLRRNNVKFFLSLNEHHVNKTYGGTGAIAPRVLSFGNRGRILVSFTLRKIPRSPLNKWAPEPVWIQRKGEKSLVPLGNQTPIPRLSSHSPKESFRAPMLLLRTSWSGGLIRWRRSVCLIDTIFRTQHSSETRLHGVTSQETVSMIFTEYF